MATENIKMSTIMWQSLLARVTRLYPFYSGCGTLANHPVMKILAPDSSDIVCARSAGGIMSVPLDDHLGRAVFYCGDLDPKITWILKRLIRPGNTVLDIGANFGLITLLMSKLVGENGAVHAFEPNPAVCRVLQSTLVDNDARNVRLHSVGLGDSHGEMQLRVPKGNFGAGSFVRQTDQPAQIHTVPVLRLDDVVAQEQLSDIALMKIDVEGFELEVFRGARYVFRELRPKAVLFESNDEKAPASLTPAMQFLRECGYKFIMIPRCLMRMKTKIVDLDQLSEIRGHDLIAIPQGENFGRMCQLLRAS